MKRSVITGSGAEIPGEIVKNTDFIEEQFFAEDGNPITTSPQIIIDKFFKITGIEERRYAPPQLNSSDLASFAAASAIKDSGIDPETLDLIIVAHNYGDVSYNSVQVDTVPSIASRVKHRLGIVNPSCIAFDVLFGCPGWIMALMQADAFFKAGMAKKALVIGTETLSRVIDKHDRDSMIFSDGAGAVVLEYKESTGGILSLGALSHTVEENGFLYMGESSYPCYKPGTKFIKMKGRKVYEYALKFVPQAMKECFEKTGLDISELKKIFIHQANEKMDEAIVDAFYKLYGLETPKDIMPMCIQFLGNSSVATIPTLFDIIRKDQDPDHQLHPGDVILFASVGAGMNINAACYRLPVE
jgi:3-oxoacyl-[acyl-carrier-protein] synthase III